VLGHPGKGDLKKRKSRSPGENERPTSKGPDENTGQTVKRSPEKFGSPVVLPHERAWSKTAADCQVSRGGESPEKNDRREGGTKRPETEAEHPDHLNEGTIFSEGTNQ